MKRFRNEVQEAEMTDHLLRNQGAPRNFPIWVGDQSPVISNQISLINNQ